MRTSSAKPHTGRRTAARTASAAVRGSALDWLRQHRDGNGEPLIGDAEYAAGQRLALDHAQAEATEPSSMRWDGVVTDRVAPGSTAGTLAFVERRIAARQRLEQALVAVGPEFANVLLAVCCRETALSQVEKHFALPPRSAKVILQYGLRALARHYGFIAPSKATLQGWSGGNTRSDLDAWRSR